MKSFHSLIHLSYFSLPFLPNSVSASTDPLANLFVLKYNIIVRGGAQITLGLRRATRACPPASPSQLPNISL